MGVGGGGGGGEEDDNFEWTEKLARYEPDPSYLRYSQFRIAIWEGTGVRKYDYD